MLMVQLFLQSLIGLDNHQILMKMNLLNQLGENLISCISMPKNKLELMKFLFSYHLQLLLETYT